MNRTERNSLSAERLAAVLGFLGVALGAFGAHGLSRTLAQFDTAAIWEKAVLYHFIHALAMFLLAQRTPLRKGPWVCFLIGIILFSGSLYVLAATNARWLGAVTPFGGTSFLIGWIWLVFPAGSQNVEANHRG
jgi:uncharacterized membrane protein YgdD (TMEM256/DUF423 family)